MSLEPGGEAVPNSSESWPDTYPSTPRSAASLIVAVLAVTLVSYMALDTVLAYASVNVWVDRFIEAITLSGCVALALGVAVIKPLRADAAYERARTTERARLLTAEAERQEFDPRMHRALEMAETEVTTYDVVRRVLDRSTNRLASELLPSTRTSASPSPSPSSPPPDTSTKPSPLWRTRSNSTPTRKTSIAGSCGSTTPPAERNPSGCCGNNSIPGS